MLVAVKDVDERIDLRGTPCPLNFVRTKLKLQQMADGQVLEVWLDGGEPIEQVPHSLSMAGFSVDAIEERDGFFALRVCRPADAGAAAVS